jgi:hypothetical protein
MVVDASLDGLPNSNICIHSANIMKPWHITAISSLAGLAKSVVE